MSRVEHEHRFRRWDMEEDGHRWSRLVCEGHQLPVVALGADGQPIDLAATPSSSQAAGLDVERLANMREVISGWLDAERLLDTMTVDDGPALQDAWDAVHFTREQVAAEYDRLAQKHYLSDGWLHPYDEGYPFEEVSQ